MLTDWIAFAGFVLAVFAAGIAVGKLVEKIERLDRRMNDTEKRERKNDRR